MAPHMVKQVIVYSDGSETVINYRGTIENGNFTSNEELAEIAGTPVKRGRPKKTS